ncbi:MAG: signal recognition particle-docking protein FtsY [Nanoarchaeota archaeon]
MFKFLKEKIKNAVSIIGKKVEKEAEEELSKSTLEKSSQKKESQKEKKVEKKAIKKSKKIVEEKVEKKGFFSIFKKKEKEENGVKEETDKEEPRKEEIKEKKSKKEEKAKPEEKPIDEEKKEEKKSFFGRIKEKVITKRISGDKFEELFFDLEIALLENNVAIEVVEKIREDLKKELVDKPILRGKVEESIKDGLKNSIEGLFLGKDVDFVREVKKKKPFVILFLGINGSGKTTTIAKVANLLMKNKLKVVLGAGDTFRAASIEQLKSWGDKLGVKTIRHDYGSDPAAVGFDAKKYAESHGLDVVLIDTAGRLQSNKNLMEEIKKMDRVIKPDMKIFVGEAITGNDCVEQAKSFDEAVGLDAIILTKMDVDEKGGAFISTTYVTKKPIVLVCNGQELNNIKEFDKKEILNSIF